MVSSSLQFHHKARMLHDQTRISNFLPDYNISRMPSLQYDLKIWKKKKSKKKNPFLQWNQSETKCLASFSTCHYADLYLNTGWSDENKLLV